ncbi:hypothetical protein [Hymenobacter sp. PAMC 26628]|uniref:hypothetical protein n=1 Tax=Hymenobacter sp. PAMC 26628 TaxID=1484118 RepID=UPI0007705CAA|nr:hypothetical protein [Hymenobacter sp. PAMC 26628]AMJ67816.1 hypothetical protein AXW84_22115 [Hymenobacter sp. PAMC 26628]
MPADWGYLGLVTDYGLPPQSLPPQSLPPQSLPQRKPRHRKKRPDAALTDAQRTENGPTPAAVPRANTPSAGPNAWAAWPKPAAISPLHLTTGSSP